MSKEIDQPLQNIQAQVFPTEDCNLSCKGCPYPGRSPEEKAQLRQRELPPDKWKVINDYLYNKGVRFYCIMGGEPASYEVENSPRIDEVIKDITTHHDAFVLLSTTGIHLLRDDSLRERVAKSLMTPADRQYKNGIAISFDGLPYKDMTVDRSRAYKARQGLELVRRLRAEYGDQITFVANVMVTRDSLAEIPEIQSFLEDNGVNTNLCTQQVKCFGAETAIFNTHHLPELEKVAAEMLRRKLEGKMVVNSAAFLSQLPGIIGQENYRCWEEPHGSPVIDVGYDGKFRYCNWIGLKQVGGAPGKEGQELMDGKSSWDEFWASSKETTRMLCRGCSWSRRDRGLPLMVPPNPQLLERAEISVVDLSKPKYQNLWVQAQLSIGS